MIFVLLSKTFLNVIYCMCTILFSYTKNITNERFFFFLFQSLYKAFAFEEAMKATYQVESPNLHNNV